MPTKEKTLSQRDAVSLNAKILATRSQFGICSFKTDRNVVAHVSISLRLAASDTQVLAAAISPPPLIPMTAPERHQSKKQKSDAGVCAPASLYVR